MTIPYPLIVVIHETLITAEDSIKLHGDPNYYASYHALVHRSGDITYLTPSDCKAYAAATSVFIDTFGEQQEIEGSVDDFAYHITLETPPDGVKDPTKEYHIGYTKEQYKSLAWLCASTGVAFNRIITHGKVSIPTTLEPRCFNEDYFFNEYEIMRKTVRKSLDMGVLDYGS